MIEDVKAFCQNMCNLNDVEIAIRSHVHFYLSSLARF